MPTLLQRIKLGRQVRRLGREGLLSDRMGDLLE
jgi:hypothetical protein